MATTEPRIRVRRIQFGHENETNRHWFRNNQIMTHFLNSLHTVFPDGERLFIRSVKYFEKEIQNPELKERVKAFIGQEMQHGIAHERFLKTLDAMGLAATEFEQWYAKNAYAANNDGLSAERVLLAPIRWLFGERAAERLSLSATAALEHYTATLGEIILRDQDYYLQGLAENMKQLFLWHAAEEIEHKSVAYDVFTKVAGGSYAERQIGFLVASFFLAYYIGVGWAYYLLKDEGRDWKKLPADIVESVPVYFRLLRDIILGGLQYLKPDFHPDQIENDHLAREVFSRYAEEFARKSA